MSKKEYSAEQLKIINEDISLEVVNSQALRRLIEKAEANNDATLASKLKDCLLHKQMDREVGLQRKKAELRIANKSAYQDVESVEYSEKELTIVNSLSPLDEYSSIALARIYDKALIKKDSRVALRMENILSQRALNSKVAAIKKRPLEAPAYSDAQLKIIQEEIPIEIASGQAIRRIREKAIKKGDDELVQKMTSILKDRKVNKCGPRVYCATNKYSETHLKVIRGELSLKDLNSYQLIWFNKKALLNSDTELSKKIEEQIALNKKLSRRKNHKASEDRDIALLTNRETFWKTPRITTYTEYQVQVIRGEIPIDQVHSNTLINIYTKAFAVGDMKLAERLYSEIKTKREASVEKHTLSKNRTANKKRSDAYKNKEQNECSVLTILEEALLDGDMFWSEFTVEEIKTIIKKLEGTDDSKSLALAKKTLYFKQNSKAEYRITSHEEAKERLKTLFETALDKPNDWQD